MNAIKKTVQLLIPACLYFTACNIPVGVYEQTVAFKNQAWTTKNTPSFIFNITDTLSAYNIYLIIRHTDAYRYNNIWMKFYRKGPDTTYTQQIDVTLANNNQGWLGTGMDDIWEQRIAITQGPTQFRKSGNYEFTLEQIMREDPLQHVMNVGVRVEKEK